MVVVEICIIDKVFDVSASSFRNRKLMVRCMYHHFATSASLPQSKVMELFQIQCCCIRYIVHATNADLFLGTVFSLVWIVIALVPA